MKLKHLSNLDLNQNELQNARLQNLATAPSSPVSGQAYFNTTVNKAFMWNGTAWIELTSVGTITSIVGTAPIGASLSGSTVTVSISPASGSAAGSMSSADFTKLAGVATGANNYVHPNHTGDVTSTGDGVTAIAAGVIVDADVNSAAAIGWTKISKTGSSLADLATRSAGDLSSGTLLAARLPALTGDVTMTAGTNTVAITAGAIVDADVNASANIDITKLGTGLVTTTEFNYLDGVTSAIQTQLNAKAPVNNPVFTGTVTLPADPTLALQAATKQYVDAYKQGLDFKESVRVATTANITLSGIQTIDGVTLVAGDRVLVKDQTTGSQNGIYVVASGSWTRATDADTSAKVTAGMFTFVESGTVNDNNGFVLTTNNPITFGTTALVFTQFSGAGQIITGVGLTKSGNTISVIPATTTTLGGIIVGTNLSVDGSGVLSADNNAVDTNYVIKYESFVATEGQTAFTLTTGTYVPNKHRVDVRLDNLWQDEDAYIETSSTVVTLNAGISAGTKVVIKYIQAYSGTPYPIHGSDHVTGGIDVIPDAVAGGNSGLMSGAMLTKLNGIAAGATLVTNPATNGVITINGVNQTVYTHPSGDGNLHVPANGTGNANKTLKATATAGSYIWGSVAYSELTGSGSASITTLGTVTTGVWNSTAIAVANGGTGGTTAAAAKTNLGFMTRYAATIGNGTLTSIPVTHNLGTRDIQVILYDATTFEQVIPDITMTSTTVVTLDFAVAPTTNQYRVVVMG